MRLMISFAALLLSVVLVQLGSGALAPLDVLSGASVGFTTSQIGLLGSAHFLGFFVGCWWAPRVMGTVGHSRAFAAFAAAGAIGAAAHPPVRDPHVWAGLRTMTGFSVAGCYTVIEAWLQAKADNANRGRITGIYRITDLIASLGAQALIAVLPPASYVSYNILAILCCLCLVPIALTTTEAPKMPEAPRLRVLAAFRLSPLAAAGVFTAGVTMPAFRMAGPIYGLEVGLDAQGIALFLAAAATGGAIAQVPVGWIADKVDRRKVLIALSLLAAATCWGIAAQHGQGAARLYLGAFLFVLFAFTLYSVSAAHADDFAEPGFVVELNAALMFIYGMGAILSPLVAAALIGAFGPSALFAYIAVAHLALVAVGLWRMTRRPAVGPRTPYRYTPRTSLLINRLLARKG